MARRRGSTDEAGASDAEWRSARDEAIAVLRDALRWNMTAARWAQAGDVVEEIASAAASASPDALWQTTGSLELFSPPRVINRIGGTGGDTPPLLPAPRAVRARIVELVDSLLPPGQPRVAGDVPGSIAGPAERARRE